VVAGLTAAVPVELADTDTAGLVAKDTTGVGDAAPGLEEATGRLVAYSEMISVVTFPILPGQSVTVGAQDVIVYTDVE